MKISKVSHKLTGYLKRYSATKKVSCSGRWPGWARRRVQSQLEGTRTDYEATKTSGLQQSLNGFKPSSLSISTGNGCDFNFRWARQICKPYGVY